MVYDLTSDNDKGIALFSAFGFKIRVVYNSIAVEHYEISVISDNDLPFGETEYVRLEVIFMAFQRNRFFTNIFAQNFGICRITTWMGGNAVTKKDCVRCN